jgi:hypothetical protein
MHAADAKFNASPVNAAHLRLAFTRRDKIQEFLVLFRGPLASALRRQVRNGWIKIRTPSAVNLLTVNAITNVFSDLGPDTLTSSEEVHSLSQSVILLL